MDEVCSGTISLYLDLMKKCLTNWIYLDSERDPISPPSNPIKRLVYSYLVSRGYEVVFQPGKELIKLRRTGKDWPKTAHTMVGMKRLDNLQWCIEEVLAGDVRGDLIETGVWRGGASIFMRAVLKAHGVTDRTVLLADSFEGLPQPNPTKYPQDDPGRGYSKWYTFKELAVSLERVKANFELYDLLDEQVVFLKGWFRDTLPNAPIERLAILRLDGDLYESTMDAMTNLYPKLSPGGFIIIDDYHLPNCAQAVYDYRREHNIAEEIMGIDSDAVYWKRITQV